jgi:hypothetical protein
MSDVEAKRLEGLWSGEFGRKYIERNMEAGWNSGPFRDGVLKECPGTRVLEVGCNIGGNLQWVAQHREPQNSYGVDISACVIEKHFTLSRQRPGPDSAFSLEPHEFRAMVDAVRTAEQSLGLATPELARSEDAMRAFRRSLFVVSAMRAGEAFTPANVRSIRPADGLHPPHLDEVLGRHATRDIKRGTPLDWSLVG